MGSDARWWVQCSFTSRANIACHRFSLCLSGLLPVCCTHEKPRKERPFLKKAIFSIFSLAFQPYERSCSYNRKFYSITLCMWLCGLKFLVIFFFLTRCMDFPGTWVLCTRRETYFCPQRNQIPAWSCWWACPSPGPAWCQGCEWCPNHLSWKERGPSSSTDPQDSPPPAVPASQTTSGRLDGEGQDTI